MESLRTYIVVVVVVTVALFAALLVQSTGGFSLSRLEPRTSMRASAPSPANNTSAEPAEGEIVTTVLPPSGVRTAPLGSRVPDDERMSDLAEQNRRLRSANQVLEERLSAILNWILVNFRGKFPLPESLFGRVRINPLMDGELLNPEVAELLKMTHDEEERMNDAFAFAFDYLREIEAAILTVSNPKPGKVILHIPAFHEDGAFLKEDLYRALEATLGQSRFGRFLAVAEDGLKENFYQFGEASRTMVFELTYVGNDPRPQLLIKDGYVVEIGPDTRSVTAVESVVTNLPAKYAAYMGWLPEYVNAHAVD
jgi:hypothetical protein